MLGFWINWMSNKTRSDSTLLILMSDGYIYNYNCYSYTAILIVIYHALQLHHHDFGNY